MLFPDLEASVVKHLTAELGVTAATSTPGDLESHSGFVRIQRGPGGRHDGITDVAVLDVEVFAPTRAAARLLAERAREAMQAMQGTRSHAVLYDQVVTSVAPYWLDYRNSKINRFVASYTLAYRAY